MPEPDVLESINYNPELMGAWLLGYDVAAIVDKSTIETMAGLIENKKQNLILQMAKSLSASEDEIVVSETLLNSYKQGFQQRIINP